MAKYYCNKCLGELEEESACGSVSYFCDTCKGLVSRSVMLSEEEKDKQAEQIENEGKEDA